MAQESYEFTIEAENQAVAGNCANALADTLREADGVLKRVRVKADADTMDLGSVVSVLATSGAALAIAQGLAANGDQGTRPRPNSTPGSSTAAPIRDPRLPSEAAARAFMGMASDLNQQVAATAVKDLGDDQPARGTLLFCSSPIGEVSMGAPNAERTLFTGAVLEVLHRASVPSLDFYLTL
jgi:hypothetical protein